MTYVCVVAALLTGALFLSGQLETVKLLVSAGDNNERAREQALADSIIGKTEIRNGETEITGMLDAARARGTGANEPSRAQLIIWINDENERYLAGSAKTPAFQRGTISIVCQKPNFYWLCGSIDWARPSPVIFAKNENIAKASDASAKETARLEQ